MPNPAVQTAIDALNSARDALERALDEFSDINMPQAQMLIDTWTDTYNSSLKLQLLQRGK